jgi:hypothetical protein
LQRQKALWRPVWWVPALAVASYFVPELVRYVWDRRGTVTAIPVVALAVPTVAIAAVALFILRTRNRKAYASIEIVVAARLRKVRRCEEARPSHARGHQPVHEGETEVCGQAREQRGAARAVKAIKDALG